MKKKPSERIQELVDIECCLPNRKPELADYVEAIIAYLNEKEKADVRKD